MRQTALQEAIKYFNGDELAANVWLDKYALQDNEEKILEKSPEAMHHRLAKEFARIEKAKFKNPLSEEEIFSYFDHFKYIIPQGGAMFGIGNKYQQVSLSNCFFLDIPMDSYADIMRVDEQLVQISKRRGGVGVCLDELRPAGTATHNAAKSSTGIVSFAKRYSHSINEVGQEGRRGAAMIMLSIEHPQVEDFIAAKIDTKEITGANISVKISDEFMQAVMKDKEFELHWPINAKKTKVSKIVKAKELWHKITTYARNNAEPGILFWSTVQRETSSNVYPEYEAKGTNPCVTGDTLVLTEQGNIRIDMLVELENKPKVASYNEETKTIIYDDILQGSKTRENTDVIKFELDDGNFLTLTPDHKVFTENRGWIIASQLTTEDILLEIEKK